MKLFYKPGACSLASHIVLNEIGEDFELEQVDTDKAVTSSGSDYLQVNPKGYVPALMLETGEVLTEGASILQYLADQNVDYRLAPAMGSVQRARLQEYLNFVSSELHKAFGPFFSASATEHDKQRAADKLVKHFDYLESVFSDQRQYLLGDDFSVADAYLFVVTNWAGAADIDIAQWPALSRFMQRVAKRAAVQQAMSVEGLQ